MLNSLDFIHNHTPNFQNIIAINSSPSIKISFDKSSINKYIYNIRKYLPIIKPNRKPIDLPHVSILQTILEDNGKTCCKKSILSKNHQQTRKNTEVFKPIINKIIVKNDENNITNIPDINLCKQDLYPYNDYRNKVLSAIKLQKIFNVCAWRKTVRDALIERGWIEKKVPPLKFAGMSNRLLLANARPGNDYEAMFLTRIIGDVPVNFIWGTKFTLNPINTKFTQYRYGIRRSRNFDFTNKEGLIGCVNQLYWNIPDHSYNIEIPRSYRLQISNDNTNFLQDYRLTCCFNLIKYMANSSSHHNKSKNGDIPLSIIDFATTRIRNAILILQHADIENTAQSQKLYNEKYLPDYKWDKFCYNSEQIIKGTGKFLTNRITDIERYSTSCKILLHNCTKYWPNINADGYHNLWILKPANCSRGIGIEIKNNYNDIIKFLKANRSLKYVVQKYIEKPMLIYKTKFDIRQYILLTFANNKFNIWMYKNCYLRFSSQEYQLNKLNKSIHITNNSIQRYIKNGVRSHKLPRNNMWNLSEFQIYLESNKKELLWENEIYPQMKNVLISIICSSLDNTEITPNTFGLYGADFILDFNYKIHLLEINSSPDMSPTTCVTETICPQVQEDVIKVVIDLPQDQNSNTGDFELIYSVCVEKPPHGFYPGMMVFGKTKELIKNNLQVPQTNVNIKNYKINN